MAARPKIPALVHHKPRDLALVKVGGRIIYLGKWGSDEAQKAYARVVASVMAGRPLTTPTKPPEAAIGCTAYTVGQLASDYIKHAEQRCGPRTRAELARADQAGTTRSARHQLLAGG
jgi:hypothetical protein